MLALCFMRPARIVPKLCWHNHCKPSQLTAQYHVIKVTGPQKDTTTNKIIADHPQQLELACQATTSMTLSTTTHPTAMLLYAATQLAASYNTVTYSNLDAYSYIMQLHCHCFQQLNNSAATCSNSNTAAGSTSTPTQKGCGCMGSHLGDC